MSKKSQITQDIEDLYALEYAYENVKNIAIKVQESEICQKDPRIFNRSTYFLYEIIFLIFAAMLSGAMSFKQMEAFGIRELKWLRLFLPYESGTPSHDTIRRIVNMLTPNKVMNLCQELIETIRQESSGKQIALDGKAVIGHYDSPGNRTVLSVSAYDVDSGISLAQKTTHNDENKEEGEFQATDKLLNIIEIKDKVLTGDAGLCYESILKKITQAQGNYVFALKKNHPALYSEAEKLFSKNSVDNDNIKTYETEEAGHGRKERRQYRVLDIEKDFPKESKLTGLRSIIQVVTTRTVRNQKSTFENRYYISSLCSDDYKEISQLIRNHWSIENKLHYVLDVTFKEDDTRSRNRYGVENLLIFRRLVLTLINRVKNKESTPQILFQNALDRDYRTAFLARLLF